MPEIHGQCLCGTVRFKFDMEELAAYQCHCSLCRKASGSAYTTTLMVTERHFVWLSGWEKISSCSKESGYRVAFCSCCGSPVPNRFRDLPLYSVPLGSLDDAHEVKIVAQIFWGSKAEWEKADLQGKKYSEMPSLGEMLQLLHVGPPS